jgi:hypothetical protein
MQYTMFPEEKGSMMYKITNNLLGSLTYLPRNQCNFYLGHASYRHHLPLLEVELHDGKGEQEGK